MRILVIDDETLVREALQRVLAAPSVTVSTAADASTGLAAMRQSPADLVIIEAVLPGMDGVAAIKEIRRTYPAVRIIAISGGGKSGLDAVSTRSDFDERLPRRLQGGRGRRDLGETL